MAAIVRSAAKSKGIKIRRIFTPAGCNGPLAGIYHLILPQSTLHFTRFLWACLQRNLVVLRDGRSGIGGNCAVARDRKPAENEQDRVPFIRNSVWLENRYGIIEACPAVGCAHRSHLPTVDASPEYVLTGLCTTPLEKAEESKRHYSVEMATGAKKNGVPRPVHFLVHPLLQSLMKDCNRSAKSRLCLSAISCRNKCKTPSGEWYWYIPISPKGASLTWFSYITFAAFSLSTKIRDDSRFAQIIRPTGLNRTHSRRHTHPS